MAVTSGAGSRSRRPTTSRRTPFATSRAVSVRRWRANNRISAATSVGGRFQLSAEKANNVSAATPWPGAASTTRRTASAPARWPAARGRPRRAAHRPLPSMMIATWREVLCNIKSRLKKKIPSALAGRADQGFHVVEVALQRAAAQRRQPVLGLGDPARERFATGDVLRLLELACVHAQIAVRRLEEGFQLVERQRVVARQRTHDAEAHSLVDQAVQLGGAQRALAPQRRRDRVRLSYRSRFSHRTSVR